MRRGTRVSAHSARHLLSPLSFPHCDQFALFPRRLEPLPLVLEQITPSNSELVLLPRSANLSCVQHKRRCFAAVSECPSFPFRPRRLFAQLFALSLSARPSALPRRRSSSFSVRPPLVRSFAPRTELRCLRAPLAPPHFAFHRQTKIEGFANREYREEAKCFDK